MKYATRPAPPPPTAISADNRPISNSSDLNLVVKPKPPRPPPPRVATNEQAPKSGVKLFSNIFGASKKNSSKLSEKVSTEVKLPPPKIPPPFSAAPIRQTTTTPIVKSDAELINFNDSPPASPVAFIKKSNTGGSDSVSMDSFCSSNSSPNNLGFNSGTTSQAESGFEDDFSVSDFKVSSRAASRSTTFSNDPFDCLEEISSNASIPPPVKNNMHSNIRNLKPQIQPKPVSIGNTNFYAATNSAAPSPANFEDSLSNGKNLIKPATVSMPTIIKPISNNNSRKASPIHVPSFQNEIKKITPVAPVYTQLQNDDSYEEEPPSPPMPTIPAPVLFIQENDVEEEQEKESYGIALYDFESDVTEDLSFKANEKLYLIKQMNNEWMYGRNKRGCEGIFPINYIDIKVPLKNTEIDSGTGSRSASVSPSTTTGQQVRVLYSFNAEMSDDLTINENEYVSVIYEINSEWLYGCNVHGQYGQFPAGFIEYVPHNLPPMPK